MMRYLALMILPAIAGCSQATPTPDSTNPGHCLAAFNDADFWFKKDSNPETLKFQITFNAMAIYLIDKLQKQGTLPAARSEAKDFIQKFGDQPKVMDGLLRDCAKSIQAEPGMMNNRVHWTRLARLGSERCQKDDACRTAE